MKGIILALSLAVFASLASAQNGGIPLAALPSASLYSGSYFVVNNSTNCTSTTNTVTSTKCYSDGAHWSTTPPNNSGNQNQNGQTITIPSAGVLKTDGTNLYDAASTDIVALFGSGSCSGYLKSDGTCSTPTGGGSGTVTSFSLTNTAPWLATTVSTPSTTPAVTLAPATGQTAHRVLGTGTGASFGAVALSIADLPTGTSSTTVALGNDSRFLNATQLNSTSIASLSGLLKLSTGTPSAAASADVVSLFGSGSCSGYLKNDGTCSTPTAGSASFVSLTGQPTDNSALSTALSGKQSTIGSGTSLSADQYSVTNAFNTGNHTTLNGSIGFYSLPSYNGGWIDMPNTGASGIGSGGVQNTPWMAYADTNGAYFNDALAGDIIHANSSGHYVRLGISTGSNASSLVIGQTAIQANQPFSAPSLTLTSTGSQPGCTSSTRGQFWYNASAAGTADFYQVCEKNSSDAYAWISPGTGGGGGSSQSITSGAYSATPGTCTTGDVYFITSGFFDRAGCTSTNTWTYYYKGAAVTPAAKLTMTTDSTTANGTIDNSRGAEILTFTSAISDQSNTSTVFYRYWSAPTGSYTKYVYMKPALFYDDPNPTRQWMVGWRDSTTPARSGLACGTQDSYISGYICELVHWTAGAAPTSSTVSVVYGMSPPLTDPIVKLTDDGSSTRTISICNGDTSVCSPLFSEGRTSGLTNPAYLFYGFGDNNNPLKPPDVVSLVGVQ